MSTINIAIAEGGMSGPNVTTWEVWETEASVDYDGFGTFTIMELGGVRTVLIRSEHWDWQTSRYASGFCVSRKSDFDPKDVADFLWKRLMGKTEQS